MLKVSTFIAIIIIGIIILPVEVVREYVCNSTLSRKYEIVRLFKREIIYSVSPHECWQKQNNIIKNKNYKLYKLKCINILGYIMYEKKNNELKYPGVMYGDGWQMEELQKFNSMHSEIENQMGKNSFDFSAVEKSMQCQMTNK